MWMQMWMPFQIADESIKESNRQRHELGVWCHDFLVSMVSTHIRAIPQHQLRAVRTLVVMPQVNGTC
jgi:hypothetical protein